MVAPSAQRKVAYLTDVEGMWHKLESFARDNPLVRLEGDGTLHVADGAVFVFGGDAIDRGDWGRRVVRTLLEAKRRQPDRVVLLAGNRDINKLRLWRELDGFPPGRTPEPLRRGKRGPLLRWIFENTMGARAAFEHRRVELQHEGRPADDEAVAESYLEDLGPGGPLRTYLQACVVAHREGGALFLHGGITEESLFGIPGGRHVEGIDAWIAELNAWYRDQVEAFVDQRFTPSGEPGWAAVVAYQAPVPGSRRNRASVVYGRCVDSLNNPLLPPREVMSQLEREGVFRVIVGHTPNGDSPSIVRAGAFSLIVADASHSRVRTAPRVLLDEQGLDVVGDVQLDVGRTYPVRFRMEWNDDSLLGLRDAQTGDLVKGVLGDGRFLLFRYQDAFRFEQTAEPEALLRRRRLVVPASDTK